MPKFSNSTRHGVQASYSVSQNFLTSAATIRRLIRLAKLQPHDNVIEIGAGKGHITRQLLAACHRVTAYEIDPALCASLRQKLPGLHLVPGDFLRAKLPDSRYKVFANIPFCITSGILRKLTQAPNPPKESFLILERGAALRFMGKPRETAQSLALKPFFTLNILCPVDRLEFHPMPRVDIVFVRIAKKAQPDLPASSREGFMRFVEHGLRYGLYGSRGLLTARQVATALREARLPQITPSGETLYIQWLCLFRCYAKYKNKGF